MNGCVHRDDRRPLGLQAMDGLEAAMSGTVVQDPEDASGGAIRFLPHHILDQAVEGRDAAFQFAATEYFSPTHIPSSEIDPGTTALVFVLDAGGKSWRRRQRGVFAPAGLDAGLLISGKHAIMGGKWVTVPDALVEIEEGTGFLDKQGIPRKDPTPIAPGTKGVAAEPAPDGGSANVCNQPLGDHLLTNILCGEPGQGEAQAMRQLTGEGLYLNDETGGKNGQDARPGVAP